MLERIDEKIFFVRSESAFVKAKTPPSRQKKYSARYLFSGLLSINSI